MQIECINCRGLGWQNMLVASGFYKTGESADGRTVTMAAASEVLRRVECCICEGVGKVDFRIG